jgi:protein tyrosine phosphatase (PTP) superfamily phosphohydrolase (DUF442 family)
VELVAAISNILIVNKSALVTDADVAAFVSLENLHLLAAFTPAWGVAGTLYFGTAPEGAWVFTLQDGLDQPGDLAYHYDDAAGKPDAFIDVEACQESGSDWRTVLDHEVKEGLVDPACVLMCTDGITIRECCDPVEESLIMSDGVPFSNFVLPQWCGLPPVAPVDKFDFLGILNGPCPALGAGGYIEQDINNAWATKWGDKAATAPGFMASRTNGRRAWRKLGMTSVSPIQQFARVDDILWRGAKPDAAGYQWLKASGCQTIINLEWEESDDAVADIVEVRLPDWEPLPRFAPAIEDHHIRSVLAAIKSAPKPVFVHCHSGQNRTGVAVAAYRIVVKGDAVDAVVADMKSYGGIWADSNEAYVRSLATRRAEFLQP